MAIRMDSPWAPTPPQPRRAFPATQLATKLATKLSTQLTTWQGMNTAKYCSRRHLGILLSTWGAVTRRQTRGDSGDMDGIHAKAASQIRPSWPVTSSSRMPVNILNAEALHYAGSRMSNSTSTGSTSCLNSTVTVAFEPSARARRKLATSARTPPARSARLRHWRVSQNSRENSFAYITAVANRSKSNGTICGMSSSLASHGLLAYFSTTPGRRGCACCGDFGTSDGKRL